jgi:type I restriction enzyme S subunit
LFPDSFEQSTEEIPKGWHVGPYAENLEIFGGGTPKTAVPEYWNGTIPWFSVVDAPRETDIWVLDTEKKITQAGVENSSTQVLPEGTTIISARGTVGRIALVGAPMAMNQSCYGLRGRNDSYGFFTYFATRTLVSRLQQHAHGSVFDTITRDTLERITFIVPPPAVIKAFEKSVYPALERLRTNLKESLILSVIRDALLPKLVSGKLRLKNAERIIGRIGINGAF